MAKVKYVWDYDKNKYVVSDSYVSKGNRTASSSSVADSSSREDAHQRALARAAVKDLDKYNSGLASRQQKIGSSLYNRGASDDLKVQKFQLGGQAANAQKYRQIINANISKLGLDEEQQKQLLADVDASANAITGLSNVVKARTGDRSVLNGMDRRDDRYKEYERLLKLSGYDELDAKVQTQLPKEVQKQPTAVVDIPADYDFNVLGDDIFRARYGEEKDGTKLTEEQRQMYKRRVETVTGVKDFDALSTSEQLNLTYDPDYLDQMQEMNSGAQTYQDVLDITQAYGNEDVARDAMTVRDYQEGHVQVSEDEYNRAKNRLGAIGGGFDLESLFGNLDDLDNYVKYVQAYASQARGDAEQAQFDDQIQQKYGQYQNAPNWNTASQPVSLDINPRTDAEMVHEAITAIDDTEVFDRLVRTYSENGMPPAAMRKYNGSTIAPEQRKMFNYLWNTHGQDAAMQYLEDIDWSVSKAAAAKTEEVSEELSDGVLGGAAASIASVLASPARAVTTPINAARTAAGQEINQYDPIFNVGRASDTIRKNVGGNLDELLGNANILGWNIGSGLYNAAMSAADSWMLAPFGAGGAAAVMGLEASDSAMREALANGRTQGEALRDAAVTAGIESITEKLPMETLFGDVVTPGKYFISNALAEMGEELTSEGLNMLYDTIAYGDESDLGKVVSELRTLGYAGKDLTLAMVKEVAGRMRDAGFGGLAGGSLGAAGRTVTSAAENASIKKNLSGNDAVKPMLNLAETLNLPEDIRNIVQDQLKAVSDGKKVSAAKIGRIFRETMKAVDEKTQSVLSASMSRNVAGMLRGVGVDDFAIAEAVTRIVADNGTAGAEDYRMVATNAAALKATEDLVSRYDTGMETQRKADEIAEAARGKVEKPAQVNNPPEAEEEAEPASETDELTPEEMEAAGIQSDVQIDEQAAKEMVDAAAAEYGRNADIVAAAYETGQDPVSFNQQFRQAYQYGEEGRNYDVISKSSTFSALNEQQIKKAYLMGRDVRVQRAQEAAKQPVGRVKVGNVDTSKIRGIRLNESQSKAVGAVTALAKAIGFNVEFFASAANADGKFTDKNGGWSKETRTISIDINAGRASTKDVNYAIMQTVGHELTHFIKDFADTDLFAQYQEFVMGHLSEKVSEKALDDMVQQYIKRWAENDAVLDRDGAIEEIVADASGDALLKLTEADLQQLAQSNPSLLKKIGDFIQRWVKNTKALIEKAYTGQTARNPIADQMVDAVDELGRKWAELLKNATVNAANFTVTNAGAVVSPEVAEIMESGDYSAPDNGLLGEKNSIRETAAWAKSHREQYPDDAAFEQNLALVENFDRNVAADSVARYLVPHGRIPKTVRGPLRNNVEYVYTFDMDTKCERTYQFLAYRDAIQKRIGRQLTEDEARCLIEQMRAYGQMIPCTYCYVEGKRMKLAELYMKYLSKNSESVMGQKYSAEEVFDIVETARSVVSGYLDNRFNVENNYTLDTTLASGDFAGYRDFEMPISEEAAAQEIYDRYNIADKSAKRVVAGFVAEWVYSRRMDVPQNLVNTDVDFESAGIDERVLAFHDLATKAAQGGAKAKGIENYEPYVDQLKNVSVEDKRYMVGMGGIRKHSSNDFQIQNVQDYMLFFMDLAADKRGGVDWTGHTYTKNLDYARIFAPTNDRINVSIAMYGDNTSGITPNTQEGVEWEELKQIRKQYKNVGAMAMVTNNDQLSFALNSSWIDMIIPFHASGMKRSLYYDVLAWTDYTSKQSERLYTKGQMIDKLREKGIKVNSSAKAADVLKMFMENFDVKVVYNEKTGKRVAPHFFPGETIQHGVKIPGHGNDAQRYFELCEQYGTNPRFFGVKVQDAGGKTIDVTQHPSYLKLIKETARTDTPQQPIVAKFDMDYVNEAMSRFRGYSNLSEDTYGIVDEFVREYAGKKRKVGYLTERAQQYKEIRAEMAAEEAAKRAAQREELTAAINAVENEQSPSFGDDSDVKFSVRVTDRDTLKFLDNQETVTTYKTMQVVDGKLYPPMAAVVAGKYEDASQLGTWEQATERPDLIKLDKNGKPQFTLNKGKGKGSLAAAYNPYMHSSNLVLNDQFSGAYDRPNLVTVQCEVPVSELTSGYHAQYAKDSVGWHAWHTGTVAGALRRKTGIERQVLLSRWIKPVRIVPEAEVAQMYKDLLDGTGIAVPDNVVPPALLRELKNTGVEIAVSGRVPDGSEKLSVRHGGQDYSETFARRVDQWLDGKIPSGEVIFVSETPEVLRNIGFTALPVTIDSKHMSYSLKGTYEKAKDVLDHVFDVEDFKRLPQKIKNPIAVIASSSRPETSVVEIIHMKSVNGKQTIAAVHVDKAGKINNIDMDTHAITSVHGRGNALTRLLSDALRDELAGKTKVYYWDKKRASSLLHRAGLQLPRSMPNDGYVHSIREVGSSVKERFESQTQTQQFRNWFKGSKVVNEDGSPKVMYHGTSRFGFYTFDTYGGRYGLMGMGSYFTDNKEVAEGYTKKGRGNNPGIYEVYLSVKNPINMDARAGAKLARAWADYFDEYLLEDSVITGDMTNEQILRVVEEALRYDGTMTVSEVAELFDGFYRSQGFDGITHIGGGRFGADNGVRHQVVIAFEPEQVKSATDNIGTFDPNDADIRHQLRDPDQISDRELLANVMESAAENAAELDFVRRYRKQLDQLDQKQADMEAAHAEMVAARKAGKKDEAVKLKNKVDILAKQIDRMDGQLLKFEAGKPLQAVVKRQREQLREKANERIKKRVEKVRQQESEKRDELRARIDTLRQEKNRKIEQLRQEKIQKVKEVRDEKNESFARQKYLDEVKKSTGKLREMVTSPTNKKHVPQVLRQPIADFLTALDFTSAQQLNGGEATKADNQLENAMLKMKDALQKVQNSQNGLDTTGAEYFSGYMDLPAGYAETFDQIIGKVRAAIAASDGINGTPINRMKSADLHELAKHLRMLHTAINNMNNLIANAKYATAIAASQDTIADLESIKAKKDQNVLFQKLSDFVDWKNSVPYYAFQRMGRGGKAIFEALMDGWDKLAFNAEELVKFTESTYNAKEVKAWESEIKTIELESGESVRMTASQLMSLYCLAKREQAMGHLMGGGIRIADIEAKRGKRIAQGENYILSEGDISKFRDALTDRQREVADALQKDMVKRGGDWGNEISMRRFGYNMFTERNYFPVESDSNNLKAKDPNAQENSLLRLLNMSATKDLVKGANNAIVVRSIFDVYTAHMSDMAKYNALGLQILDMMKWLNYVERTEEVDANGNSTGKITTESVQKSLELAYGTEARRYIMEFIKNLNGEVEGGREDGIINKFTSNYKIAAVGANLRVGFLQITSLPRAAVAIDSKYLLAGIAKWNARKGKVSAQAVDKVGIAKWKSMGFYDTNISRNMRQMIKHDEAAIDKVRDGSMKLAEWGDAWTMGVLYGAVESELMSQGKKPGDPTWDAMVNKRLREIVYRTQVVDSTMTRSHLMRQKGNISGALAFMSEPTLALNMLNDALFESRMNIRAGVKWNPATVKKVAKVFAVSAAVNVLSAFVEAAFTAMRDDDEFETIAEKYLDALWGDYSDAETYGDKLSAFFGSAFGGKLNPLSNIPVISDMIDAWKSGAAEQMWQAFAGEMGEGFRAIMKVMREGGTLADYYRAGYKMLSGLSKASGIPANNAVRDLASIYNTFAAEPMGWKRIQTYDNTKTEAAEAYYAAIVKGDSNRAGFILERAEISGLSAADVADATATLIKEDYIGGRISESEARQYLSKYAKRSTDKIDTNMRDWGYQRNTGLKYSDMKRDYLDGLITKSQAQTLLMQYRGYDSEEVYWQLSKWDYEKATGEEGGKYSWFLDAVDAGYGYEKYAQELLNRGVDKSDIASAIASAYKSAYLEIKGTAEGDRMLEYLLDVYESIGYDREYERDYIAKKWK